MTDNEINQQAAKIMSLTKEIDKTLAGRKCTLDDVLQVTAFYYNMAEAAFLAQFPGAEPAQAKRFFAIRFARYVKCARSAFQDDEAKYLDHIHT